MFRILCLAGGLAAALSVGPAQAQDDYFVLFDTGDAVISVKAPFCTEAAAQRIDLRAELRSPSFGADEAALKTVAYYGRDFTEGLAHDYYFCRGDEEPFDVTVEIVKDGTIYATMDGRFTPDPFKPYLKVSQVTTLAALPGPDPEESKLDSVMHGRFGEFTLRYMPEKYDYDGGLAEIERLIAEDTEGTLTSTLLYLKAEMLADIFDGDMRPKEMLFGQDGNPIHWEVMREASIAGNPMATVYYARVTGLSQALHSILYNDAMSSGQSITPEIRAVWNKAGYLFDRAEKQRAAWAQAYRMKMERRGYEVGQSVIGLDPAAPPNRFDIERAINAELRKDLKTQGDALEFFYPLLKSGFFVDCDETWCYVLGRLGKLRFSVQGEADCGAVSDNSASCSFPLRMVYTSDAPEILGGGSTPWNEDPTMRMYMGLMKSVTDTVPDRIAEAVFHRADLASDWALSDLQIDDTGH